MDGDQQPTTHQALHTANNVGGRTIVVLPWGPCQTPGDHESAEKAFVEGSPTSGESETTRFRNQKKWIRGVFEPLSLRMVIATPRVSKSLTADVQSVGYALDFWLVVSASAMGTL